MMSNLLKKAYFPSLPIEARFRSLVEEFCIQSQKEGIELIPYRESSWTKFRALSIEKQHEKLNNFFRYYRACAAAVDEGLELRDTKSLVERTAAFLGARLCDDVLNNVTADDVIEIYSADFTQLFRNLKFLEICSYPVVELYTHEWVELYRRPHVVTEKLIQLVYKVLAQETPHTIRCDLPNHFLEEVFSLNRHKFFIEQKYLSPLITPEGKIMGFIGTLSAQHLDTGLESFAQNVTPLSH